MVSRPLALALVGVVLLLQALAYASPPDETWLGGFWDDDDYDDVILLVISTLGAGETVVVRSLEPRWALVSILRPSSDGAAPAPPLPRENPRAPPLS